MPGCVGESEKRFFPGAENIRTSVVTEMLASSGNCSSVGRARLAVNVVREVKWGAQGGAGSGAGVCSGDDSQGHEPRPLA